MCNEGFSRRDKDDFASWEPAIVVEHDGCCDEGFAETCWEGDENVVEESSLNDIELIFSERHVCRVYPCFCGFSVDVMMCWGFIGAGTTFDLLTWVATC